MMVLVESQADRKLLQQRCARSAFGCKMLAYALAYGYDKQFVNFWLDTEGTAAFCMVDGVFIITGTVSHPVATREFLRLVGAKNLICAVRNADLLEIPHFAQGDVMRKELSGDAVPEAPPVYDINIREVYDFFCSMGMVEEFEPFYMDLSHKLRHGQACIEGCRDGAALVGCALVSANLPKAAILSAVAVAPAYRRNGVATELVRRIEKKVAGKTVYLFKEKGRNDAFYKSLGYKKVDTWVTITMDDGS